MNDAILRSEIGLLRNDMKRLSGAIEKLIVTVGALNTTITQKMEKHEALRRFEKK